MTTLARIADAAGAMNLALRGALHEGTSTVVLLGPDEPGFWPAFTASPEYTDGAPHPLDRWSKRVIGALADGFGATAAFPYDGPPYPPFLAWAAASGEAWQSPVGLLVHAEAGLFISYRGALILPERLKLPAPRTSPCTACADRPCLSACPVRAMGPDQAYDVTTCKTHARSAAGRDCRDAGCLVRRACPVSQGFGRVPQQSAFHMAAFL